MLTGGLALRALVLVAAVRSEIVSKWFACDANCPPLNATARAAARCGGAPRPRVAVYVVHAFPSRTKSTSA